MRAIVVTDRAAGTGGMSLAERPAPDAAWLASLEGANYGDVVVEVHASGFTGNELEWPSTWVDRRGLDRRPGLRGPPRARPQAGDPGPRAGRSGHRPQLWHNRPVGGTAGVRPHGLDP